MKDQKSINEMGKERGMVVATIIGHLEKLVELGPERGGIELSELSYLKKEISPMHYMKIEKALEEVALHDEKEREKIVLPEEDKEYKPPLLSPVKSKVGNSVSFREIQLARVLLGYVRKWK